jgi:hypothetical protein
VGAGFLARLLRGGGGSSGDAAARGDGGAALAAAVAAALCRAPALASAPAFGAALVTPLLSLAARSGTADAAVADALDAAAAAAAASHAGREAALAAGGVAAAASALTARRGGNAPPPPELAAPAAALLSALLSDDAAALATHAQAAAACLPPLAAALAASPGHAVQFEALRAALLLLAPPSAAADAVHAALCDAGLVSVADSDDDDDVAVPDEAPWADDLARGVAAMLAQARLPAPVRHAALRACAGAARLRGPAWLACAACGALLTPLVEVAVVEATVAMHSLARPEGAAPGAADEAATLLGLCLAVFEAAVEALAASAANDEDESAKSTSGSATVTAALRSLGRLAAVLLDFLEDDAERCAEAQAEPGGASMDADGSGDDDDEACPSSRGALRLAALRALGCFLAEVPGAHRERVLKLLRWVLSLRSAASPGGALGFLLPALLQATDVASAAAAAGADDFEAADAGVRDALAAADALVDAGGCASLAAFARAVAAEAGGEEGAALGEAALAAALGVMRNVLARGVLAPSADVDPDAAEARDAAEKAFPPALAACVAWARDAPPDGELAAALRDARTPPAAAAHMLDWLETLPC